jgi:hypothetical protein
VLPLRPSGRRRVSLVTAGTVSTLTSLCTSVADTEGEAIELGETLRSHDAEIKFQAGVARLRPSYFFFLSGHRN